MSSDHELDPAWRNNTSWRIDFNSHKRVLHIRGYCTSRRLGSPPMKLFAFVVLIAMPLTAASLPDTRPEDVGLSRERLLRIHEAVQHHIDTHQIAGAVTLVARKGRIAHLEAHGVMDLDSKNPMA